MSENIRNEIRYMCGSIEECRSDYLRPILEAHGYGEESFGWIDTEDDHELMRDIAGQLFGKNGMFSDFASECPVTVL